jgi:hypothetical protein
MMVIKYKPGYEYLYRKHKMHYRDQINGKELSYTKNMEWLFQSEPPDDEEKWYKYMDYHCIQIQCELAICNNCGKILNPKDNMSFAYNQIAKPKERYFIGDEYVCKDCKMIEDEFVSEFEECTNLIKKIRDVRRKPKRRRGMKKPSTPRILSTTRGLRNLLVQGLVDLANSKITPTKANAMTWKAQAIMDTIRIEMIASKIGENEWDPLPLIFVEEEDKVLEN